MDHDAQGARAQSEEFSIPMDPSCRSGLIITLLHWECLCVGDNVSTIGAHAVRIVAVQAAGGT